MFTHQKENLYHTWLLIRQTSYEISRLREFELQTEYGISIIQALVLFTLSSSKIPLTPSDLSRLVNRERHSVHELINRMEKDGLVIKRRHPENKRKTIVDLTEKGKNIYSKTRNTTLINNVISILPPGKMKSLQDNLEKIRLNAMTELALAQKSININKLE